jgi:hypothetical protein
MFFDMGKMVFLQSGPPSPRSSPRGRGSQRPRACLWLGHRAIPDIGFSKKRRMVLPLIGWVKKGENRAKKWCFFAKNASALTFWAGFLQLFAAQNDQPEFGRSGGGEKFRLGRKFFGGGIYGGWFFGSPEGIRGLGTPNSESLREFSCEKVFASPELGLKAGGPPKPSGRGQK